MCMRFDCNPQIIFVTFLQFELSLNLVIFCSTLLKHIDTWYLLNATSPTNLPLSFSNLPFILVLF